MCWYRALFQIGVQIGKQADDSVFGVGCWGELRASPCSLRSRPPSRSEGGGNRCLVTVFFVAALLSLESGEGFCVVYLDSLAMLGGLVLGEGVSECVGFVGALHPV